MTVVTVVTIVTVLTLVTVMTVLTVVTLVTVVTVVTVMTVVNKKRVHHFSFPFKLIKFFQNLINKKKLLHKKIKY